LDTLAGSGNRFVKRLLPIRVVVDRMSPLVSGFLQLFLEARLQREKSGQVLLWRDGESWQSAQDIWIGKCLRCLHYSYSEKVFESVRWDGVQRKEEMRGLKLNNWWCAIEIAG